MSILSILARALIASSISSVQNSSNQTRASNKFGLSVVAIAGIRDPARRLPFDLVHHLSEHVQYDWDKLLDIFPQTESNETYNIRDYVRRCKKSNDCDQMTPAPRCRRDFEVFIVPAPIEVDNRGDIIRMYLVLQRLKDYSIRHLWNLPSTLKDLCITHNELTTFDVSPLPRGLERLELARCRLTHLDFTKLPPALVSLDVSENMLPAADLTALPPGMRTLWLTCNELKAVNLSQLPLQMEYIGLEMNYLSTAHFETLSAGCKKIKVEGKWNQKLS